MPRDAHRGGCISWCRSPAGRTGYRWKSSSATGWCNDAPPATRTLPAVAPDLGAAKRLEYHQAPQPAWEPAPWLGDRVHHVQKSAWGYLRRIQYIGQQRHITIQILLGLGFRG